MARAMPATHETNVTRALLIAVIVVALVLGAVALAVVFWPESEQATVVPAETPSAQIQSSTAAEHGIITPMPQPQIQSSTAAERGIVTPAPQPPIQSSTAAEHDIVSP